MKLFFLHLIFTLITRLSFSESKLITSVRPKIEECSEEKCKLPNCLCSAYDIPGGLNASDTPQIVVLTLTGINTVSSKDLYEEVFNGLRKNPNGQNISATIFITHEYNNYSLTHQYWREGHEIALNSITRTANSTYWASLDEEGWRKELGDQRDQVAHFAKIPPEDIQGVRSPNFFSVPDAMYNASRKSGLRYDNSRPTLQPVDLLWPYTGDYQSSQSCITCPKESHPGFWMSPIVSLTGSNGVICSIADTCSNVPSNASQTFDLFYNNFLNHYRTNRAPFGIHANVPWLTNLEAPYIKEGYIKFIDEILSLGDVYIVSISKALDWVQSPKALSAVDDILSWRPAPVKANGCPLALLCAFNASQLPPGLPGQSRFMVSCQKDCPPKYPWLDNPLGRD